MSTAVAKSGWLYRQSTVLRRWKRSWFVLSVDGYLRHYEAETSLRAEEALVVPREVLVITSGLQVDQTVQPPENKSRHSLLVLKLQGNRTMVVCADSEDDSKAWHLALEQARVIPVLQGTEVPYPQARVPGYAYYPQASYPGHYMVPSVSSPYGNSYLIQAPNGATTVVVRQNPTRYSTGDVALGMVAGAALGTMMWTPLLW